MNTIIDIPLIYKYIAQRKWRKLCILFKLFPQILQFNNDKVYCEHYHILFNSVMDLDYFIVDLFKIGIKGEDQFYPLFSSPNELFYHSKHIFNVLVTIKKRELSKQCDTVIKKMILQNHGKLTILSEFGI